MAKIPLKKGSKSLVIREMQIKGLWDSTLYQSDWLRSKTQVIAYAGEDEEKDKHASIDGGIANWYNHSGSQFGASTGNWK